ncbi:hypothetical protein DQK91_20165 [Oceanidesulfovibrio marinus]|uniref:Multiubiquitin n=1 Tax=Oceanidesulfovibrio marinus TaxID=370038 RepID=A0A6P1ZAT1_9BACT|nr:hypothetical protein E8L03_16505 [Oceanidesulfovibrio marinus]TVM30703.1 hypothetical protein DQK91_20165 [Oceanidesulfovibrio marinus]
MTIRFEPDGEEQVIPKPNTVLQLLNRLGERPGSVLVIREPQRQDDDGKRRLLTPDLHLRNNEIISLRRVTSRG